MTGAWEDELADIRAGYVRDAAERLEAVERALDAIAEDPASEATLRDVIRRFHVFSGSGTTFGFPEVTAQALAAEQSAMDVAAASRPPSRTELADWRERLQAIRREFAQAVSAAPAAKAAEGSAAVPIAPAAAPSVWLVGPQDGEAAGVRRMVEAEGVRVVPLATYADAEAALARDIPAALVVDASEGGSEACRLVAQLRRRPAGARPVVLLSAAARFVDKVEAIHAGADGVFAKADGDGLVKRLLYLLSAETREAARVLVVEDDPHQAAFARSVLSSAGYDVRVCDDPMRFEVDLTAHRPDLVLMDVLLPGMSGFDLVRFLRQSEQHATVPALFLTSEGQARDVLAGVEAGGDDYLRKPVSPPQLLATVAARLERARFLRSLLERDGLTRLLTHSAMIERAKTLLKRRDRDPSLSAAWVMLDVDHFKKVNDTYGHPVGDQVLMALAALLRRRLRASDTLGRYGGEEFVCLLSDVSEEEVVRLVTRVREEFRDSVHRSPDGATFQVTFSAGVAMSWPDLAGVDEWMQAADQALYQAKHEGRDCVRVYRG